MRRVKEKAVNLNLASRLEKGGKDGKSASRVGKNLKMLIESTRLFGTQEYLEIQIQKKKKVWFSVLCQAAVSF